MDCFLFLAVITFLHLFDTLMSIFFKEEVKIVFALKFMYNELQEVMTLAELQFTWLGPPEVKLDGQPLRLEIRKGLALLAYLSLSPQPPTRETLSTLLWPEFDQTHALSNLRRNLSSLASSLPPGILEAERERVSLNIGEHVQVDVMEFHSMLAQANTHTHPNDQVCGECFQKLEHAVGLYRGDFFAGFNLKDCVEFDDWQFFQREGLRAEYARVFTA